MYFLKECKSGWKILFRRIVGCGEVQVLAMQADEEDIFEPVDPNFIRFTDPYGPFILTQQYGTWKKYDLQLGGTILAMRDATTVTVFKSVRTLSLETVMIGSFMDWLDAHHVNFPESIEIYQKVD